MAGAGVTRGAILGASDRMAAYPLSDRYGPWDVIATILAALGIEPKATYKDQLGQPYPASIGAPIARLYHA